MEIVVGKKYWTYREGARSSRDPSRDEKLQRALQVEVLGRNRGQAGGRVAGMDLEVLGGWRCRTDSGQIVIRGSSSLSEFSQAEIDAWAREWSDRADKLRWIASDAGKGLHAWPIAERLARERGLGELTERDRQELINRRGLPSPEQLKQLQRQEALRVIAGQVRHNEDPWSDADRLAKEQGLGELTSEDDGELIRCGLPSATK